MQKNNTVLIIIIALILFLPSSSVKSEITKTWIDNTSKYELLANEGLVAFEVNESPLVQVKENIVKCECNGTGKIRTGDNRILPCPCNNCQCSKSTSDNTINLTIKSSPVEETQKKNTDTVQDTEAIDISLYNNRCLLFTNPEWCVPCRQVENDTIPVLIKAGYKIGSLKESCHITKLDEEHPLYTQLGIKSLPTFIFIKNGKIVKIITGYYPGNVISDEFNKSLK